MKSLTYLLSRKMKNKLSQLVKSPGKLILTVGFILLLVMNLSVDKLSLPGHRALVEFYAIIFAFYILCFFIESKKGFEHGGAMFSLSDVNFLFLSPVKPAAVLLYGMLGRIGTSMWMGLAFIYQFSLLRSNYNISFSDMIFAVIGYGLVAFLSQLSGMLIYFFTCGDEEKLKKAKTGFYALILIFALPFFLSFDFSSPSFYAAAKSLTADTMKLFPVAGWVFALFEGIIKAKLLSCVLGAAAVIGFTVVVFVILSRSKHGYYEDVLLTAERLADSKGTGQVKLNKKTLSDGKGIGKGEGANVIYSKHRLENRRTKTSFFAPTSIFYLVLIALYGFLLESDVISLFMISSTTGIVTVLSGRWLKELTMPYIYLIPEKPVKKLFYMLPEMLPRVITESLLQSLLIAFIVKGSPILVVGLTVARISFCFVLMASALLTARFFREKEKNNIFASVCIFLGVLFSLPTVVVSALLLQLGMGILIGFGIMSIFNIITGFILLFFARKLLSYSS